MCRGKFFHDTFRCKSCERVDAPAEAHVKVLIIEKPVSKVVATTSSDLDRKGFRGRPRHRMKTAKSFVEHEKKKDLFESVN